MVKMAKEATRKPAAKKKAATKRKKASGSVLSLFTIGYEQAKPAAVLDELKQAKIDMLVDVRAKAAGQVTTFTYLCMANLSQGIVLVQRVKE